MPSTLLLDPVVPVAALSAVPPSAPDHPFSLQISVRWPPPRGVDSPRRFPYVSWSVCRTRLRSVVDQASGHVRSPTRPMTVPGFSVTDLLQAINKGKQIYDTFRGEYENAPARIRELVDTSSYLVDVLQDVQSLLDQYGDVYPQEANFGRKLDEVGAFIDKYKALKREYGESTAAQSIGAKALRTWQQALQTTHYAFDDQRARDIKDGLQLEIQKLLLFILVFALCVFPREGC